MKFMYMYIYRTCNVHVHVSYMCFTCRELNVLKESRERQKEMVESIVKQRDMYRILLAQSTPLPDDHTDTSQVRGGERMFENYVRAKFAVYFYCFFFSVKYKSGFCQYICFASKDHAHH